MLQQQEPMFTSMAMMLIHVELENVNMYAQGLMMAEHKVFISYTIQNLILLVERRLVIIYTWRIPKTILLQLEPQ